MEPEIIQMKSAAVEHATRGRGMLSKLLGLLSDAATYGMSNVLGQVVQFLLLPIYTRLLGPSDYGIYAMLVIVTMLFGPLANLGMSNAIFRRFNTAPDHQAGRVVLGTGLLSVIFGSLAMLALTLPTAGLIAKHFVGDATTTDLVRLSLLSATFATIAQVPNVALRARRKVRLAATLNFINVVILIGANIALVVGLRLGVKGLVLGGLAADATSMVLALACTWGLFELRFDRSTWKSMISYGLPFVPHRIQAVALAQFSQYMVREMLGLEEAGIYSIAARFALPVGVIVNAIQEAWIPYKFQMHAQEQDARPLFGSIFTYYCAGVAYLWVGVSAWGFDVVRGMTTSEYHAAAYLLPVLALLRVSQGLYFMLGTGIELSDRTGAYPVISLTGLATVVAGAFLLVDPLGAFGAALASVLSWLVMAVAVYVLAQRRLDIAYDWSTIIALFVVAAGCVAATYAVQSLPLPLRLGFNVAVSAAYPVVVMLMLSRSPAERHRVRILFSKLRYSRTADPQGGAQRFAPAEPIVADEQPLAGPGGRTR